MCILKSSINERHERNLVDYQDVINREKFVHDLNITVQKLKLDLDVLNLDVDKSIAKSTNDHNSLMRAFENLSEKVNKTLYQIDQRMGDLESKYTKEINDIKFMVGEIMRVTVTKEYLTEIIHNISNGMCKTNRSVEKLSASCDSKANHIYSMIKSEIESVRADLKPIVPDVDPVKKAINERFEVFKVDFDGLYREISIIKKNVAYGEKKFEDIYTSINKLKGK